MGAALGAVAVASIVSLNGQSPGSQSPVRPTSSRPVPQPAEGPRALLDQYCVTCHNDRLKTANLSLQGLDLSKVADHAELWEKVVRKLRAGVMPPPDVPRPPLASTRGCVTGWRARLNRWQGRESTPARSSCIA